MQPMRKQQPHRSSQTGQGMTEYVIIIALIAISTIALVGIFGDSIKFQMAESVSSFLGNGKSDVDKPEITETSTKSRTMKDFARSNDKRGR